MSKEKSKFKRHAEIPNPYTGRFTNRRDCLFGQLLVFRLNEKKNTHFKVDIGFPYDKTIRGEMYEVKGKGEIDSRLKGQTKYRRLISLKHIPDA